MMPVRRNNQTWLPSIFNDFFDNEWMEKANATAPAINKAVNKCFISWCSCVCRYSSYAVYVVPQRVAHYYI